MYYEEWHQKGCACMPLRSLRDRSSEKVQTQNTQSMLPDKRASLSDVLRDIKQYGFADKEIVASENTQDDEIRDERIALPLVQETTSEAPLPWSEFNRVLAEQEIDDQKKLIKDPFDLVADIFVQNAILGPRQKFKYELFCSVVRLLYRRQYKINELGLSKAVIKRGVNPNSRIYIDSILVAAEKKGIVNRFTVRERIVYALSDKCARMMQENLLAKLRESLE